ncbi:sugar phosphate isomerase/epimerase family protein [Sphingobium agri]|uniref:Sugar phosphate isomerase/epimerase n=1 Tax=Sphingobium agri TaxID=2933566 RepID=A0ABT0DT52_9SPHN|nr:sugar phosphate isomerase/epimerase [Sphingobium agri]MCK0530142.1 sugar phosphate isomerase/epimerase [Sphingobium agri]
MNRRDLLKSSALLMLAAGVPAMARRKSASLLGKDGAGVQLYMFDPDLNRDFDGALASIAATGVRSVELASLHRRSATEFRAALDKAGLVCRSAHVAASSTVPGASGLNFDDLDKLVDQLNILGSRNAVLPLFQFPKDPIWGPPISFMSLMKPGGAPITADRYERMADFLNEKGAVLKKHGIRIGYHNHNGELAPLGNKTGLQILLERTDPSIVDFELDAGWLAAGGHDTAAWLERYRGRFTQMHVKDIAAGTQINYHMQQKPTEVGSGIMNWPAILKAARGAGVRNFFVEQEPPFTGARIDSLKKSLSYLRKLETA